MRPWARPRPVCQPYQLVRLGRLCEAYPDVAIGHGHDYWQAVIGSAADSQSETVITRYTLTALLDELDELLG
jgi:hypothetical protein